MKRTSLVILLLLVACSIAFCQVWVQASIEHKFNKVAGLSVSNEIGYNINPQSAAQNLPVISPSIDYTYYSNGESTEHLLFKCATASWFFSSNGVIPYVSITGAHLTTFGTKNENAYGYSGQLGIAFDLTKNDQFFFQYRYFKYETLLQGQLTQFGIMHTF